MRKLACSICDNLFLFLFLIGVKLIWICDIHGDYVLHCLDLSSCFHFDQFNLYMNVAC